MIDETSSIERLQFFNGQRLFASDLQGLETFNREMRWLHNRTLHQPGIGNGYAVGGAKGDREITVGPGYAVDALGREIILTREQVLPIPPVAGDKGQPTFFDLVVAYPDDTALAEAETREGICSPGGVLRLAEQPVFCWAELEGEELVAKKIKLRLDIQNSLKIRVARIEVLDCQLNAKPSIAQRQSARPAQTPYVASGTQPINVGPFSGLAEEIQKLIDPLGHDRLQDRTIITTVDTSSAGFLTTPEYTVQLSGPRHLKLGPNFEVFVLDRCYVSEPKRDSFELLAVLFIVRLTGARLDDEVTLPGSSRKMRGIRAVQKQIEELWQISWMGVEA